MTLKKQEDCSSSPSKSSSSSLPLHAMAPAAFDIIVVGAGIMGSCAAYYAASRGSSVLLLEQFSLLHARGSSHGNSRTFRATYAAAHYPPLVRRSYDLWLAAEAGSARRVLTPVSAQLLIGPRDDPAMLAAAANAGDGAEELDAAALRGRYGGAFRLPEGWAAVTSKLAGVIDASAATEMFQSLARARGAVIKDNAPVVGITAGGPGDVAVRTAAGEEFKCGKCIVAAGAWARKLVRSFTSGVVELPVQPVHVLILYWRIKAGKEKELSAGEGFPTFVCYGEEPRIYGTPSLEHPGLIKILVDGGAPCDPDCRPELDAGEVAERVKKWIATVMPEHVEYEAGPAMVVPCMYSMTPDGDFVVDWVDGAGAGGDVVVAAGFSGHGFKMAPAVGKMLAEMAVDGTPPDGVAIEFGIGRFAGGTPAVN